MTFTPTSDDLSETVVEGKYIIHDNEVVGRGAWSVVKKCTPISPYLPQGSRAGMKVVVKIIEKDYLITLTKGDVDRAMSEVRREIDVLRHIPPHENVVTFLEYIETAKQFLLFFEEVRCGDLCELILGNPNGKLTEEKSKLYTYQIIKAVLHCHLHDVVHRDIKPENLLVDDNDNIKLTDFGLAKRSKGVCTSDEKKDPLDLTALMMPYPECERLIGKRIVCSDVIGTSRYGGPEMFYAKFTQTHYDGFCADTWSIGVVTYIMMSGSFPYTAGANATEKEVFRTVMDTPLPQPANISPLALDFLNCLLNKDPSKRIPLYAALNHPWLADVVVPRGSVVASQLRQNVLPSAVEEACSRFDQEAKQFHVCIGRLQYEIVLLREERERLLVQQHTRGMTTTPQRAQTPSGTSRIRQPRLATSSVRVAPPGRPGATRVRAASRDTSSSSMGQRRATSMSVTVRTRSPLARSVGPLAVRRGTPARTSGMTPMRSMTPTRPTSRSIASPMSSQTRRVMTPSAVRNAQTPTRELVAGNCSQTAHGARSSLSVNPANELHIGDQVYYKGCRAVVRFNGSTAFGAGVWIGLQMLEGNEGTNDGSSFIDKRQYFTCPKGKGVFVRASQVRKI